MADDSSVTTRRAENILQELLRSGEVEVESLAQTLGVSTATVRRDLDRLERQGLLRRNHGGALPVEPLLYEPFRNVSSFQEQEQKFAAEKRRIGLRAAELVADGEIISICAGTTTTHVARSIRHRKNLTVFTNTINVAMELSHRTDLKVYVTGGYLSGDWFALVGPAAIESTQAMYVDKIFLGVDGIHHERGLTSNYPDQATIHHAMLKQAATKIVVADHRKIGVTGTALICQTAEIDFLITDLQATDEAVAPFIAKGVNVLRV